MKALDRLRAFENSGDVPVGALTKPPEVAFVSSVSARSGHSENIQPSRPEPPSDPDARRRHAKALAILAANPAARIAVVAEAGDPAIVGIAIRGQAYSELEIPGPSYDGLALIAMLERYGGESIEPTH